MSDAAPRSTRGAVFLRPCITHLGTIKSNLGKVQTRVEIIVSPLHHRSHRSVLITGSPSQSQQYLKALDDRIMKNVPTPAYFGGLENSGDRPLARPPCGSTFVRTNFVRGAHCKHLCTFIAAYRCGDLFVDIVQMKIEIACAGFPKLSVCSGDGPTHVV